MDEINARVVEYVENDYDEYEMVVSEFIDVNV